MKTPLLYFSGSSNLVHGDFQSCRWYLCLEKLLMNFYSTGFPWQWIFSLNRLCVKIYLLLFTLKLPLSLQLLSSTLLAPTCSGLSGPSTALHSTASHTWHLSRSSIGRAAQILEMPTWVPSSTEKTCLVVHFDSQLYEHEIFLFCPRTLLLL